MKKVWIFELFQNYTPPGGGQLKKVFRDMVGIHPVVWAPNPNKQTDRPLLYI